MNCCDDYGNCRQGRDCPIRPIGFVPPTPARYWLTRLYDFLAGIALIVIIAFTVGYFTK